MREFAELIGEKIRLRPFRAEDITDEYLGWLSDPEVTRYSNQRFRRHTRSTCEAYLAGFAGSPNLFVSICTVVEDKAIGTMTAYHVPQHGTCDVGIMVGERDYWGGGFGQEAWNLFTTWLIEERAIRKLTAGCLESNGGMIKLMERSGMHREAVRVRQEVVDGKPEDIVLYARFAD